MAYNKKESFFVEESESNSNSTMTKLINLDASYKKVIAYKELLSEETDLYDAFVTSYIEYISNGFINMEFWAIMNLGVITQTSTGYIFKLPKTKLVMRLIRTQGRYITPRVLISSLCLSDNGEQYNAKPVSWEITRNKVVDCTLCLFMETAFRSKMLWHYDKLMKMTDIRREMLAL